MKVFQDNLEETPNNLQDYIFGSLKGNTDRQHKFSVTNLPRKVDLRPDADEVEQQENTMSCVGQSVSSMMEIITKKKKEW